MNIVGNLPPTYLPRVHGNRLSQRGTKKIIIKIVERILAIIL